MKNFTRGTLLTLIILFSLGWAQQEVQDNAFVRVAHLSPNAEQVSITLASTEEGGQQLSPEELSSLSYRDATDYLQVPEGEYDVAVETPQGTLQETLTFNSGVYYTVAAIGLVIPENLGQEDAQQEGGGFFGFLNNLFGGEEDRDALELRLVSYEDEFVTATTVQPTAPGVTPDAPAAAPVQPGTATGGAAVGQAEPVQTARVRLVHAAPGTAPVSLVGVVEGQEQEDNVFVSDLPFAESSSYNDLSAAGVGNYEVRLEGSKAVALDLSDISLEPGDIYTLFVIGTPTEEAPLEVLSLSSQPTPQGATPIGAGAATGGAMSGGAN